MTTILEAYNNFVAAKDALRLVMGYVLLTKEQRQLLEFGMGVDSIMQKYRNVVKCTEEDARSFCRMTMNWEVERAKHNLTQDPSFYDVLRGQ